MSVFRRRNYGRDDVILHGSGPTTFPAIYGLGRLPDILQLCAEGLHLFPLCACQVPETKILSRHQSAPARNISVPSSELCLWHVDDIPKNPFLYLSVCLLHFSETGTETS